MEIGVLAPMGNLFDDLTEGTIQCDYKSMQ